MPGYQHFRCYKNGPLFGGGGDNDSVHSVWFDDILSSITDVGLGRLLIVPQGFMDHGSSEKPWKAAPLRITPLLKVVLHRRGYRLVRKGHECQPGQSLELALQSVQTSAAESPVQVFYIRNRLKGWKMFSREDAKRDLSRVIRIRPVWLLH